MRYTIILTPVLFASLGQAQTRAHAEASITIDLEAAPAVVLPLFGPVREAEWAHGWSLIMIYPADGRQLEGSIFTTEGKKADVVWVLTRFEEHALEVRYAQVLPKMWAGEIVIRLRASGKGRTEATLTYRRTSLSPEADEGVEAFALHFPEQREHWQNAINQRLRAIAEQHDQHN
jgi:hypothetical protein